jgi:mono/diheme cytochrome c family protein
LRRLGRLLLVLPWLLLALAAAYAAARFMPDEPVRHDDPVEHFKYGSTGGERESGFPYWIWRVLPQVCAELLPGGYPSLGLIHEPGRDLPVGMSKRRHFGLDRVFLNCAACHASTVRESAGAEPRLVVGMPAHRFDIRAFETFFFNCAAGPKFSREFIVPEIERLAGGLGPIDRYLVYPVAIALMRERLLMLRGRFAFVFDQPEWGPGRVDTFNSAKVLFNFPMKALPAHELLGASDFPSIWNQRKRMQRDDGQRMELHWDGNNVSVEERNRSAAFGTGAVPALLDRKSLAFIADWLKTNDNVPPRYIDRIEDVDHDRAARGKLSYERYCAECHGRNGRDFSGARVGKVEDIKDIGTDPCRLDNYTYELAVEQGNLYAGYPADRFSNFRKTNGYANMPLDGLWLRAPYLHNGSVPTVRDLLEPWESRPPVFYRGYDVLDRRKLGFVSDVAEADGVKFFRYETRCVGDPAVCRSRRNSENRHDDNVCVPGDWAGNSNRGHDGPRYGTQLSSDEKDDLVEYLKTF